MRRRLALTLIATFVVAYGALIAVLATGTTPALGLDLQGGISVTQRAVSGASCDDSSMKLAVEKIRDRVDALGVAEPEILCQGDTIVVNLPGVKNQRQAEDLVQVSGQVWLRPVMSQCQAVPKLDSTSTTTTAPGGSTTTTGSTTTVPTSSGGLLAPSSGATTTTTPDTTPDDSGTSTSTTEVPRDDAGIPIQQSDPTTQQFLPVHGKDSDDFIEYCLVGVAMASGEVFQDDAAARIDSGGWGVTVSLTSSGEDQFNAIAAQCFTPSEACPTGQMGVDLDGELQSVTGFETPDFSGGQVSITGSFTESEAKTLAEVLNSGALPIQLQLESVQNVSATLGEDSLHAAVVAGIIGVGLVLLFMIAYYRILGFIVAVGITISAALLYSTVSFLSETQGLALSLSGIAGIIVSVGVTVDSYVVFFERLKDEVKGGRSLRNSAQRGFSGAWRTIVMADLVSLIGALVLWYLTVGAVRGFAFFLGLSTLCDLVVAYFFTRPTVLLLSRTRWMERRKVMGIEVTGGAS
ncbi:MAG TPA: protein translocase subunit SecD [Ilumatobacteraceae bacterium]|nr:protein translocase subunit SecD [Ilumatobacteraceae bacterium]